MRILDGNVVLVMGAAGNLCAAIARRLGRDGAFVVLAYKGASDRIESVARVIEATGGRATTIGLEGEDCDSIQKAIDATTGAFGRLDVVIDEMGTSIFAPFGCSPARSVPPGAMVSDCRDDHAAGQPNDGPTVERFGSSASSPDAIGERLRWAG